MEKKKLKKLELKKPGIAELSDLEANMIKGGGYWDGELGYVTDEITVYGTMGGCSACNRLEEYQTMTGGRLTPIGEWLYNNIVNHDVGCPWY